MPRMGAAIAAAIRGPNTRGAARIDLPEARYRVMELRRTHYDVLGIDAEADASQVRRAWKVNVQAWHPDRFEGDMRVEAERQTSRLNEAWHTLRDSGRRAAYDCRLAADRQAAVPAAGSPGWAPARRHDSRGPRHGTGAGVVDVANQAWRSAERHPRGTSVAVGLVATLVVLLLMAGSFGDPHLPAGQLGPEAAVASASGPESTAFDAIAEDGLEEALARTDAAGDRVAEESMSEPDPMPELEPLPDLVPLAPRGAGPGPAARPRVRVRAPGTAQRDPRKLLVLPRAR